MGARRNGEKAARVRLMLAACVTLLAAAAFTLLPPGSASAESSGKHVWVHLENHTYHRATYSTTLRGVLEELGIRLNGDLDLAVSLDAAIEDGQHINLPGLREVRVEHRTEVPAGFEFRTRPRKPDSAPSPPRLVRSGRDGEVRRLVRFWYHGEELAGNHLKESVLRAPQPAVVEVPAPEGRHIPTAEEILDKRTPPGRAPGPPPRYQRKLTVESTAYYNSGRNGINSTTATGRKLDYGIVAVDPEVIPLGSRVYVEDYGYAIAADTGGAIRGEIIDVAMRSRREAYDWGRRHGVTVWVLD